MVDNRDDGLPSPTPWLVFSHEKGKRTTFFNPSRPNCKYVKNIPQMRRKFCRASHRQWLVMSEKGNRSNCFLLNSDTMETIQLPPLTHWKNRLANVFSPVPQSIHVV
uniref:KIB1-4 beta-propeller domain-containing protein n=1 Tax=Nelumbo nucifera TaxID=4432 RepID=A0A822ZDA7_NELNU|nr:TPA_asm: hypothetical protein HUJ06_000730 [Nelumbo nucifera]